MAGDGVIFTKEEARRTEAAVKHFERSQRGTLPPSLKKVRVSGGGGGGGCTCPEIHEFSTNGATSGTFSTTYTLDADSDVITWGWDASASEVETAFLAGSLFASGDITVSGGDWPHVAIYVKFNTYAWARTYVPTVDNSSLVGGKGFMRKFSEQS